MKKKTYSGVEDKMFSDVGVNDCESVSLWEWDCWLSSSSVLSLINKKIGFKIVNMDTIQYNKVYKKISYVGIENKFQNFDLEGKLQVLLIL